MFWLLQQASVERLRAGPGSVRINGAWLDQWICSVFLGGGGDK